MRRFIYATIALGAMLIATSCEKDAFNGTTSGKGGFSLALNLSDKVNTRASNANDDLINASKVKIYKPDFGGLIREYTLGDMPDVVYLPADDDYRIDVIAGEASKSTPRKANFEQKSYKGSQEFDVVAGKTDTSVEVTAKISNAITNVTFDQTVFDNFSDTYSLKLALNKDAFTDTSATNEILNYDKNVITTEAKTKEGYFIIDDPTLEKKIYWTFSGKKDNEAFTASGTIEGLKDGNETELNSLVGTKINLTFKFEVKDGKLTFILTGVDDNTDNIGNSVTWNPVSTGISSSKETDIWATFATVYADVDTSSYNEDKVYFQYRLPSSADWSEEIQATKPSADEECYSAVITGLEPGTEYEYRLVVYEGETETPIETTAKLTTATAPQVPNNSFEYNSTESTSEVITQTWNVFYDPNASESTAQTMWWDSGNKASAMVSASLTSVNIEYKSAGNQSILLHSQKVAGKLAAGNLYSGFMHSYEVSPVSGIVCFGRPFTGRPSAVKLYVKYSPGSGSATTHLTSGSDEGQIKVALGRWDKQTYGKNAKNRIVGTDDSPVAVDTSDESTFKDFAEDAKNGGKTLAYGDVIFKTGGNAYINGSTTAQTGYNGTTLTEITIPIIYYNTSQKVTHIIISCAASRFGDYFEGYAGSKMWIDDVQLIYDNNIVEYTPPATE